jgi:hypothetical protein
MLAPWNCNEPDGSWMVDLIWGNPLMRLMSNGAGANAPYATQYVLRQSLRGRCEHEPARGVCGLRIRFVPAGPSPRGRSQGFAADGATRRTATLEAASAGLASFPARS